MLSVKTNIYLKVSEFSECLFVLEAGMSCYAMVLAVCQDFFDNDDGCVVKVK